MSLERKDIRAKLDPDVHRALQVLARVQGVTDAELIEQILAPIIKRRVHEATVIAAEAALTGRAGNLWEEPGTAGDPQYRGRK